MKDPKEAMKAGERGKTAAEAAQWTAARRDPVTNMEYCHGSVCLGPQKPTHCICPTEKK